MGGKMIKVTTQTKPTSLCFQAKIYETQNYLVILVFKGRQ